MSAAHHDEKPTTGPKIISVADRHPRSRTIQVVRPTPQDANFLAATAKGLAITIKHFAKNFFLPMKKQSSRITPGAMPDEKWKNEIETVQYPEEKVKYPDRFRGLHRLMKRDDGSVRCVACMMCPTACPAHCITIVPEEADSSRIEKRPAIFEIDELRCIACGLCVEACPCDAIRMDTGDHAKPVEDRSRAIETKETMLERGIVSIARQGGEGADWRETTREKMK